MYLDCRYKHEINIRIVYQTGVKTNYGSFQDAPAGPIPRPSVGLPETMDVGLVILVRFSSGTRCSIQPLRYRLHFFSVGHHGALLHFYLGFEKEFSKFLFAPASLLSLDSARLSPRMATHFNFG
jgi:hypothetical protein